MACHPLYKLRFERPQTNGTSYYNNLFHNIHISTISLSFVYPKPKFDSKMASVVWKKLLSIVRLIVPSKANAKRLSSTNDIDGRS